MVISALANDSDIDGDVLNVTSVTGAVNGSTVVNADSTITYIPDADFNGSETLTYAISDGNGGTDTAVINVIVSPVNDNPVAADDSAVTNEDTAVTITVLSNDSDIDGDVLSVASVSGAVNGTAIVNADNTITYTPNADFNGSETLTYVVSDGNGGTDTASIAATVNPVNDAPVAGNDSFSGNEDTVITGNLLVNDSDIDGDVLSAVAATLITVNGATVNILANGDFTYTPVANFNGADSFTYTLDDGAGLTDTATVSIDVLPVNDNPVATNDIAVTDEDNAVTFDVLSNDSDIDGDALVVTAVNGAVNGTAIVNADNTITYTPNADFNGSEMLSYTISDGNGGTSVANIDLTINAVNDNPVALDDVFMTDEDIPLAGSVFSDNGNGTDYDVDGDALSVQAGVLITSGGNSVTLNADGTFTYTPGIEFFGDDSFDYTVLDGQGGMDTATAFITVNPTKNVILGDDGDNYISGGNENDKIFLRAGDDIAKGKNGNDYIFGEDGNDLLSGDRGNDTIHGGNGNDALFGGADNDVLYGGSGIDILFGDRGSDTFVFEADSAFTNSDAIMDFDLSEGDKLDISDLLSAYDPLTELITDFVQITDNGIDSYLAVDIDGGANNFVQIATIVNYIGLTDEEALEVSGNLITA
ncbi:MAG: tandem-95 repeat protein [Alphaproteobacteria bacterium]|nr:tandem-95 repeat protein [Alphaproteobacteria bacterium]